MPHKPTPSPSSGHVRLACAWSDLDRAKTLADLLSQAGVPTRLACGGSDEAGAEPPIVVIALWSQDSYTSLWVRREADEALARGALVDAMLFSGPRVFPSNPQRPVDLRRWRGVADRPFRVLLARVRRVAAQQRRTPDTPFAFIAAAAAMAGAAAAVSVATLTPADIAPGSRERIDTAQAPAPLQAEPSWALLEESGREDDQNALGGPLKAEEPSADAEPEAAPNTLREVFAEPAAAAAPTAAETVAPPSDLPPEPLPENAPEGAIPSF